MTRFHREGGRAGYFNYTSGELRGQLEWEMLVGNFGVVIYGETCWWIAPETRKMTKAEEQKIRIDLAFSDGSESVEAT